MLANKKASLMTSVRIPAKSTKLYKKLSVIICNEQKILIIYVHQLCFPK